LQLICRELRQPATNVSQRFLQENDPQMQLKMLVNKEADFVIGDPTEIKRPHADKTEYVGTLKDEETKVFWMLTLATPFRGRAIPFHFITYSFGCPDQQTPNLSPSLLHGRGLLERCWDLAYWVQGTDVDYDQYGTRSG
jgi:hypothetical protein